jgi:hypothetical protein
MAQQHGTEARDRLWSHPDLLPTSDDLDEPLDFVARQGLDDELRALTDPVGDTPADGGTDDGDEPDGGDEPDEETRG